MADICVTKSRGSIRPVSNCSTSPQVESRLGISAAAYGQSPSSARYPRLKSKLTSTRPRSKITALCTSLLQVLGKRRRQELAEVVFQFGVRIAVDVEHV